MGWVQSAPALEALLTEVLFRGLVAPSARPWGAGLMMALAGCAAQPASAPPQGGPVVSANAPGGPSASGQAPGTPVQHAADEELIREYQRIARQGASRVQLERFVAIHPALLSASAKPYGGALLWVLEFAEPEAALVLIRAGACGAAASPTATASLNLAARGGLDGVVTELLARGVSPAAADYWGTPLHRAADEGHASTMRLLIQAGADPNAQASDHAFAPLHAAVSGRHLEAVQVLISAKADLEVKDDDGRTPLHWGGFAYVPRAVHLYSDLGKPNAKPHDTVFRDSGPARAMELLLDAGANIEAVDGEGNTPLHAAAQVGSRRAVKLLLARGARSHSKNHAGETPAAIANKRGDPDIVQLLSGRP